jgi:hypothetical protein
VVQIVTLTGTLTDTAEHGVTTVGLGDVVLLKVELVSVKRLFLILRQVKTYNQLLNEHSLTDTGTTEETNLTTTGVGGKEIDDLDTSDENLSRGGLLDELWGVGVNGEVLGGLDGTTLVNGVTSDVQDTAKSAGTDGNLDGGPGVAGDSTTRETLGT